MNTEIQTEKPLTRFVSKFFGHSRDHNFVASTIIQKTADEIIEALFDYELLVEVIPQLKDLVLQDNGNAYLSFTINDIELPGCNLSLTRDSSTSVRWEFSHTSGTYKGIILLDELAGSRGTLVNFISESPQNKESLLNLIKEIFVNNDQHTLQDGVKRFKALLECGQIPTTVGQPHGNNTADRS